jgi:hypothetical protein
MLLRSDPKLLRIEDLPKSHIYVHQTWVEHYKFGNTVCQQHTFTDFCGKKCSQIVYTVTSLRLL